MLLIFIGFSSYSQSNKPDSGSVNWISMEEAKARFAKQAKPILIFIENEDSGLSNAMNDSTFRVHEVTNYINIRFYPIKINAFTKDTITYMNGQKFVNTKAKNGKKEHHDIVKFLLGDKPVFPGIIILNTDGLGTAFEGYFNRDELFPILIYFSENVFKTTIYEDWFTDYDKTYPSSNTKGYTVTRSIVKWIEFEDAIERNKTSPKKYFVDLYANWNVGATIMYIAGYNNSEVAQILNENYYPIRINVLTKDTFEIGGITYMNRGEDDNTYNDLPVAMLEGKMQFPAFIILNEKMQPIYKNQYFQSSKNMVPILKYFASDKYLETDYSEFLKEFNSEKKE